MNKKITAGQRVLEEAKRLENKPIELVNVQELGRAMLNPDDFTNLMAGLITKWRNHYHGDFYIEMNLKKEKWIAQAGLLQKPQQLIIDHKQCPTPFYDQTVWKYHYAKDDVELLWTLPHPEQCDIYRECALQVVPEERQLRDFVLSYYDGTLLRKVKELNGEKKNTPPVILSVKE